MEKAEFIQKHLIEKGVPADLTKPTAFIWSRYKDPSQKPLVFQSPAKILIAYGLFMGLINVFRTIKARKLLGETNWENWCQQHYR
ncbi:magnesium transporter [Vibrio furnissii]|uniref:magnesium transporter n=1 Tax=Vibrio furnissii TaxID=29494 RepID=UPI0037536E7E